MFSLLFHNLNPLVGFKTMPPRKITGFHQDDLGDWVADLQCGHTQHVRHNPPWVSHPWVVTPEGRAAHIGRELFCPLCAAAPAGAQSSDSRSS